MLQANREATLNVQEIAHWVHEITGWIELAGLIYIIWLLKRKRPLNGPHWPHEPVLFDEDSNPIRGLKRCKHCGLSEIYWNRWPQCRRQPTNLG